MKALLINTNTMKPVIAPIGLEYVGEYIQQNGIDVSVFDMCFQSDLKETINKTDPDIIGITIRNTDDCTYPSKGFFLPEIKRLIRFIKKITKVPIIAGGVGFSVMPEGVMEFLELEYGIDGDGEEALLQFIKNYPVVKDIPNLLYRKDSKINKNKKRFFNLKKLNPERRLFNNQRYYKEGGMGSFETSRGCNRKCIYCADILCKGSDIRLRKPDSVADEIKRMEAMGIHCFHTCDSEFNVPYKHAIQICKALIKQKLDKINFGVDSGSDRILAALGRDYKVDDLIDIGRLCRRLKITFMFDLLLGGPEEDETSIKETIKVMDEIKPDIVGAAIGMRLYKGTPVTRMIEKQELSRNNNIFGQIKNNHDWLKPVFYISSKIGNKIFSLVEELTSHDKRYLFSYGKDKRDYNYNQNDVLVNAIKKGRRGAFWDILRKLN